MKLHSKPSKSDDEFKDLGFGTKALNQTRRLINRDGSFNVKRRGLPLKQTLSFYHSLLTISWMKFHIVIFLSYVSINLVFAFIYMWVGVQNLQGIVGQTIIERFWDAFFFSIQTFTTVGYGRISPVGFGAGTVSAIESLVGLMSFALATGLIYGRFSRPSANIVYSKNAVIAPYRDITAFEFRIVNARKSQLIEAEMQVMLSMKDIKNGSRKRSFHELNLERQKVNFFTLNWTIVHPIDEESPLYGFTEKDLIKSDAEFLILLKAYDDTFAQTVHSRSSYKFNEVVWGAKFQSIYSEDSQEITMIDFEKFHDIEKV